MGILVLKIRRSWERLIFNIGISVLVRRPLYIETALWTCCDTCRYVRTICRDMCGIWQLLLNSYICVHIQIKKVFPHGQLRYKFILNEKGSAKCAHLQREIVSQTLTKPHSWPFINPIRLWRLFGIPRCALTDVSCVVNTFRYSSCVLAYVGRHKHNTYESRYLWGATLQISYRPSKREHIWMFIHN